MKEPIKANRMLYFYIVQGGLCYYCKKALWDGETLANCNIDHKTPTSRGGKDTLQNTCLSCQSCNTSKGSMTEEEVADVFRLVGEGKIKKEDAADYVKYLKLKGKFESVV